MSIEQYLALCLVCLLGAASPGPSLAVVLGAVLGGTRRAGLLAALAHGSGVAVYALLTVSGLAWFLTGAPALFSSVQLLGALYLLYLGVAALRAPSASSVAAAGRVSRPVRDGFMIAFLNPKLALFMLALFSQFLSPQASIGQKALMVATAGGIDAVWYALVVILLSQGPVLAALQRRARLLNVAFGVLLVCLAIAVMAGALL